MNLKTIDIIQSDFLFVNNFAEFNNMSNEECLHHIIEYFKNNCPACKNFKGIKLYIDKPRVEWYPLNDKTIG